MMGIHYSAALCCLLIRASMAVPTNFAEIGTPEVSRGYTPRNANQVVLVGEEKSGLSIRPEEFHVDSDKSSSTTPLFDETRDETYDTLYLAPDPSRLIKLLLISKKLKFSDIASDAMSENLSFFESTRNDGNTYRVYADSPAQDEETYPDMETEAYETPEADIYTGLAAQEVETYPDRESETYETPEADNYTGLPAQEVEIYPDRESEAYETPEAESSEINPNKIELPDIAKQLSTDEPIVSSSGKQKGQKEKESAVTEKPSTDTPEQLPTYKPKVHLEENVANESDIDLAKRVRFRCVLRRIGLNQMIGLLRPGIVCGYRIPRIKVFG